MARPVLEAMDMDTLTKGRYVQLLARGYSPKEVFKALSKGTDMEKERLRKEFDYWRTHNGIKDLKPARPVIKTLQQNRVVYKVDEDVHVVEIYSARTHYESQ
ncbi:hypothetical protein [Enterococcus faecium]|uniref:hypothetical protein n=2 Tax=Enterococcus faecium TaxID=1352 RepID=UPI002B496F51|nr:hypothetical protein [Enterococcus faecium]MEB3137654.1 hypothetical protein [Enterococcus faecium]